MNLMMLLEMASSGFADRVAVQNGADKLSYAELFAAARGVAAELEGSGCDQLATVDISSLAIPVGLFGSAWAGVPFVPMSYRITGSELDALVERITPALVVTEPERMAQLDKLDGATPAERASFLERARAAGASGEGAAWPMDPDAIAILLFTSGTTGPPKAAVIRHKHLVSYILMSVEFGGAAEEDAALVSVPPYHIAGMAAILSSVYSGRRIVQLPNFSAEAWIETARRERVTHAFVVPTMLARIVSVLENNDAGDADMPQLRALSYGGGKMPYPVVEAAMRLFPNADFTNAYGLTETSSTIAILGPDDHREAQQSKDETVRRRLGSAGRPLPGVEVEIRDEEGGVLAAGERGEICVRGEQVSGEYLGRTSRVRADGWFPTNDGGWLDGDGYLFVEGRIDDIIVRGGENLSPGEIEDVLLGHEGVADCAVVGVPDEQWGETVAAVIVCRPSVSLDADEVRAFVKAQLRSSRTPDRIEFWEELPYNETGKLLRRKVRADLSGDS